MPETQKSKPWWKSKTVWLGIVASVAGLSGLPIVAVLPPKAAAYVLTASGIAGVVLRTVTKQPISASATDEAK